MSKRRSTTNARDGAKGAVVKKPNDEANSSTISKTVERVPYELRISGSPGNSGKFMLSVEVDGKEVYSDDELNLRKQKTRREVVFGRANYPGIMEKIYKDVPPEAWPNGVAEDIEERLLQATRVPPGDPYAVAAPDDDSVTESGYVALDDGIYRGCTPSNREKLSNFSGRILSRTIVDDGEEQKQELAIELRRNGKTTKANIAVKEFNSLDWVMSHFGPDHIIWPGMGTRDHLRCAIQQLSGNVPTTTRFGHTGWRRFEGVWCFLHAGGAIVPDVPNPLNIEVSLGGETARFCLPDPPRKDELIHAVRSSLGILSRNLAPDHVVFPLLAIAYRAPLGSPDFVAWLKGLTGIHKSELAALIQQHFGPVMTRKNLPGGWSSTANALEATAFILKDVVFTIDDFIPTGSRDEADKMHRAASILIRAVGNQTGKGRMNSDTSLRPSKPPRGLILATAEELPRGHSGMARLCVLDMNKGDVNLNRLSECQKHAADGLYAKAMAGFIKWIAPQYEKIKDSINSERSSIRDSHLNKYSHARTPDTIANLILGLRYLVKFATSIGAIGKAEGQSILRRGEVAFSRVASRQKDAQDSVNPVARFADMFLAIIVSGRGFLAGSDGQSPSNAERYGWRQIGTRYEPVGRKVGWVDKDMVYLDKESAYAALVQFSQDQNLNFATSQQAFWTQMKESGSLVRCEPDRNTYPKTLEGSIKRVIHLKHDYCFGCEKDKSLDADLERDRPADYPGDTALKNKTVTENDRKYPRKSKIYPDIPFIPSFHEGQTDKRGKNLAEDSFEEFAP